MAAIEADVIIVGSGFAGSLVADRLAGMGIRTAILEAGPRVVRGEAFKTFLDALIKVPESPYKRTAEADFPISHDNDHWYRQAGPDKFQSTYLKAVGGTSWHWLGTCLRYLPSDFRMQSQFGRAVDWPISYADLEPYYAEAEQELGVSGDSSVDLDSPRSTPFPMPPVQTTYLDKVVAEALVDTRYRVQVTPQARNTVVRNGRPVCCGSSTCIPICPVGAKYDAMVHIDRAEAAGAMLHEQTTAVSVDIGEDGKVSGIRFRRPDGSDGMARGQVYVVAAHGVETVRLLLNSRSERYPNGVANQSDQVGRNLMDHPVHLTWALSRDPVWPFRGPISTSGIENLRDGTFRRDRSSLRIQITNDGWNWPTGGAITLADMLSRRGLKGKELREAVADHASRQVLLASMSEQLPDQTNRVSLDPNDRDPYGVPLPRIHYRVGSYSKAGLEEAKKIHDDIFTRMGATEVHHGDGFRGAGHIIGTSRMGHDPKTSVVDQNLRSHDHPNLFVLGSGAFPTSATANPTLTIAALALRSVSHMVKSLSTV